MNDSPVGCQNRDPARSAERVEFHPRSFSFTNRGRITVSAVPVYNHFLCAAHPSLQVVQLWTASEVREPAAWERALPSPLPRFFEKNRVKLFILRTFLRHCNASADFYVSAKLVFRQSEALSEAMDRAFSA